MFYKKDTRIPEIKKISEDPHDPPAHHTRTPPTTRTCTYGRMESTVERFCYFEKKGVILKDKHDAYVELLNEHGRDGWHLVLSDIFSF
jgi:hypothetical protein|tara:strand:+ start:234 stop:497 length:264 start_codon:yes stop_codon:yes gene_type:complete